MSNDNLNSFDKWRKKTYHPNFCKSHLEWEKKAWDAAIEECVRLTINSSTIGRKNVTLTNKLLTLKNNL